MESASAIEVIAAVDERDAFLEFVEKHAPHVVVVDARHPQRGVTRGIDLLDTMHRDYPQIGVLVLSERAEHEIASTLFRAGSAGRGYLLKSRLISTSEVINAVETIAAGGSVVDPIVIETMVKQHDREENSRLRRLTERQTTVLAELSSGKSNTRIASSLGLSRRSIEHHIGAIFEKLELTTDPGISARVQTTLMYLAERRA